MATAPHDGLHEQVWAWRTLLGLDRLPATKEEALAANTAFSALLQATASPDPVLAQLVAQHQSSFKPPAKPRFVDVSTGMRLRYMEWPDGDDVVLLLHDTAECAEVWAEAGTALHRRGYRVIALDLRGHGGSTWSSEGRYELSLLVEDVRSFLVEKDLYARPVAVLGAGLGAAVAVGLASKAPALVGAVLAAELALPDWAVAAAEAEAAAAQAAGTAPAVGLTGGGKRGRPAGSSARLLPWWGCRPGQAGGFGSAEQCAAVLSHPMANLGPHALAPLARVARIAQQAQQDQGQGEGASDGPAECASHEELQRAAAEALAGLVRPPVGAAAAACRLLQPQGGGWGWSDGQALRLRCDPAFFFSFDVAELASGVRRLRCCLLALRGARSAWTGAADAAALAALAAAAPAAAADEVPGAGRWLATDAPKELAARVAAFLEGPAARCYDAAWLQEAGRARAAQLAAAAAAGLGGGSTAAAGGAASGGAAEAGADLAEAGADLADRRPEALGLRPLPQYASLEEARKALGPRALPSLAAVESELARLRADDEAPSDEDESQHGRAGRTQTALAKDPPDYFGFVG